MPKVFTSRSQRTGELGEKIAVKYLESKGFSVLERNYTKKWGEIDIRPNDHRPEEGMHRWKIERLKRTILSYLAERNVLCDWQFDLVLIHMSDTQKQARVEMLDNLIL